MYYFCFYRGPVSGVIRQFPERFRSQEKATSTAERLVRQNHASECMVRSGVTAKASKTIDTIGCLSEV